MAQARNKEEYLTSRALKRATSKGLKEASENAMEVADSMVVVQDGWGVRIHKDGKTQKIEKIPEINSDQFVLE